MSYTVEEKIADINRDWGWLVELTGQPLDPKLVRSMATKPVDLKADRREDLRRSRYTSPTYRYREWGLEEEPAKKRIYKPRPGRYVRRKKDAPPHNYRLHGSKAQMVMYWLYQNVDKLPMLNSDARILCMEEMGLEQLYPEEWSKHYKECQGDFTVAQGGQAGSKLHYTPTS